MNQFFTWKGRLNRMQYFVNIALLSLIQSVSLPVLVHALGEAGLILGILITIATMILGGFQVAQRFHDLERPSWHFWLLLIPFYGVPYLSIVVLLFAKGTTGTNTYGTDPLESKASTPLAPENS